MYYQVLIYLNTSSDGHVDITCSYVYLQHRSPKYFVSSVRCANASNAVETLCNHLERHAAAFILSMLKTNAAAWRFHSVLDSTLWGLL